MIMLGAYARTLAGTLVLVAGLFPMSEPSFAKDKAPVVESGSVALPADLTPDQVNDRVARMSDVEVRKVLLDQLAADTAAVPVAAADAKPVDSNFLDVVVANIGLTASHLVDDVLGIGKTLTGTLSAFVGYLAGLGVYGFLRLVLVLAVAIGLGAVAEIGSSRLRKDWRIPPPSETSMTFPQRLLLQVKLFLRATLGQLAFFVVVSIVVNVLISPTDAPVARIILIWLIIFPRFVGMILRSLLAPAQSAVLEVNSEAWTRQYLYRHLYGLAIATGIAFFLIKFVDLMGPEVLGLAFWLNLILLVWLGLAFVVARDGISALVRGSSEDLTPVGEWVARVYPTYAVILIILTWAFSMIAATAGLGVYLRNGAHFATLGLLLIVPIVDAAVRAVVTQVVGPLQGQGIVARAAEVSNRRAYIRMARVLVVACSLLIIGRLWGVGLVDIAASGGGDRFAEHIIVFFDILLIGYLFWEIARLLINRKLAAEFTASGGLPADEDSTAIQITMGSSRLATVLPIFSWIVQSAIIALTVLMALSNLGVDVTALVAGAGIFGLAIGFGSQKLVSDIVSGMFFLVDDAFRIGEYVKLGDVEGTIEKFALRSMMLRDSKGPLYCVPYSAIPKVTNFARDWGIMKLKFNVVFGTDVEKVRKLFKKIGQEMMDNPDLKDGFIEPFKSQGVRDIKDGYIIIGAKFMHKPGAQFTIRKEIFRLVQRDFDLNGIKFYRSEVRVVSQPEVTDPSTDGGAAAAALAARAAESTAA